VSDLPAVLAIDGGNSKTDVMLVGDDGSLLSAVRGPGVPRDVDRATTLRMLAGLIERAGRPLGRTGLPAARHTSACLANLALPGEEEEIAATVAGLGWSPAVDVVNDTFAVLRAGVPGPDPWGVAVVCGAGINAVGVDPAGRVHRFLALGDHSGDWGGGAFLGRAALWCAARAEDGRGPATALERAVPAHFGLDSVRAVAIALEGGAVPVAALADLVPALLRSARDGDEVAASLVRRQATETATLALVAMRRLDVLDRATPVVLGGGVHAAGDELLTGGIVAAVAAGAPRAEVRVCAVPPVVGAALLGLDATGAGPAAEARLRAAVGAPRPPPDR
jgi:N-acetylglucosamine kinase-like BadF-type ATPase